MGFFSWKTSDTDRSIPNIHAKKRTFKVHVPIPKEFGGGCLVEENYDGYGRFDGQDIYILVAKWNAPEECEGQSDEWIRRKGIDLACYDKDNFSLKYPIKITERKMDYEDALPSKNCEYQGYFY